MAKAKTIVAGLVIGVVAYLVALKLLKPKPMVKVGAGTSGADGSYGNGVGFADANGMEESMDGSSNADGSYGNGIGFADANAEEDKKKKERVTLKNNLDSLVYTTEKLIKENGDKVPADLKTQAEDLIKQGKEVVEKEEFDKMQGITDELNKLSHKMAEQMYKATGAKPEGGGGSSGSQEENKKDEPIEAEFREEKGSH
jgi:molecular chaperone DnaK